MARSVSFCVLLLWSAAVASRAQDEPLVPSPRSTAATASPASAPSSVPAAARLTPGWLRVLGDDVNLRARPDLNSVIVMRMPRDTVLRADGGEYGWYRVTAPPGVFSYVATMYVQKQPGGTGIVSVQSGTLRVRVGSLLRELDPDKSDVQSRLENGTTVKILGEEGEWLRIVPPEGVYFYVSNEFVTPISDEVAARLRAATDPTHTESAPDTAIATAAPISAGDLETPLGRQLAAAEAQIEAETRRPVLEQQWQIPLDALTPLAAQRSEPRIAWLAAEWIAKVEVQVQKQNRVRAARALLQDNAGGQSAAGQPRLAADRTPARVPSSAPARGAP